MATQGKRNVSGVWSYFDIDPENPHLAKCTTCDMLLRRGKPDGEKKSYNVSSLWKHLQAHHKDNYAGQRRPENETEETRKEDAIEKKRVHLLQERKQLSLIDALNTTQKWAKNAARQIEVEGLLLN